MLVLFSSLFLTLPVANAESTYIPEYLQSISVQIIMANSKASGVVFTRKDSTKTNDISFVWTAGHAFHGTNNIVLFNMVGTNPPIVNHANIGQRIVKDGETAGTNIVGAELIKLSHDEDGIDIALLQLTNKFFGSNTVVFDLSEKAPRIGTPLYSVSGPFGLEGTFSEGVISRSGLNFDGNVFDQVNVIAYPGSSGGGVFSTNGECIGLINSVLAPQLGYIVPIRTIIKWAKKENLEWAINPKIEIPKTEELKQIPLYSSTHTNKPPIIIFELKIN